MGLSEKDIFGDVSNGIVSITPHGASKEVFLATPVTGTWIELIRDIQAFDGKTPDAATVTRVVAACMVDASGRPIDDGSLRATLAKSNPGIVMQIYKKCWDTVLKIDVRQIEQFEGNSEASRA